MSARTTLPPAPTTTTTPLSEGILLLLRGIVGSRKIKYHARVLSLSNPNQEESKRFSRIFPTGPVRREWSEKDPPTPRKVWIPPCDDLIRPMEEDAISGSKRHRDSVDTAAGQFGQYPQDEVRQKSSLPRSFRQLCHFTLFRSQIPTPPL